MGVATVLKGCLVGGAAAGAVLGAGEAGADPFGPYAGDTLDQLRAWGYTVMLNGVGKDAGYLDERERSACQITGVHPTVSGPAPAATFQTVYVDMACPPSNNSPTE